MPRVNTKTKSSRGKAYNCCRCAEPIKAGEQYYEWTFYHSTPTRQHASHGYPKQSQLTRSRMADAYSAIEDAESAVDDARKTDTAEDLPQVLRDCSEAIGNVRDEYQDGFDNMGDNLQNSDTGQETQEKIDALEEFTQALDAAADEIETDLDDDAPDVGTLCDKADEALGSLSL